MFSSANVIEKELKQLEVEGNSYLKLITYIDVDEEKRKLCESIENVRVAIENKAFSKVIAGFLHHMTALRNHVASLKKQTPKELKKNAQVKSIEESNQKRLAEIKRARLVNEIKQTSQAQTYYGLASFVKPKPFLPIQRVVSTPSPLIPQKSFISPRYFASDRVVLAENSVFKKILNVTSPDQFRSNNHKVKKGLR